MEPDEFVSLVCHDLRAHLRALKTLPNWAREEIFEKFGDVPNDLAEIMNMMELKANRLDRMVADLSAYARMSGNPGNPGTVIEDVLPAEEMLAHFSVEVTVSFVPLDADHVRVVIDELTSNALKHGEARSKQASLSISTDGESFHVAVTDSGPGFDPKYTDTVFEPLRTLKSRDACEGSGMGLAKVERIAEIYGGFCQLKQMPGASGVTAIFSCPMPS